MQIIPKPVAFEWDKWNNQKNLKKHNITNTEAEDVFQSPDFILLKDPKHSSDTEERWIIIGKTKNFKLLNIVFTIRDLLVRVISARKASRKERKLYEETFKNPEI